MELRQLQCFVAVAEELNFRRASERLNVVQPTITLHIQRLEREIGTPLFDRSTRPIGLTRAGRRLLPEARHVLAAAVSAIEVARDRTVAPIVRLGTADGLGEHLEAILSHIERDQPGTEVELHRAFAWSRLQQVRENALDAAIVRGYHTFPELNLLPVWSESLVVALPVCSPLAELPAVPLEGLRDVPLRLVPRHENPMFHDLVMDACRAVGFEPVLGKAFTTIQDTLAEVSLGTSSWAPLYRASARRLTSRRIALRPFEPDLRVQVSLAVREVNDVARLLLEACRHAAETVGEAPLEAAAPCN